MCPRRFKLQSEDLIADANGHFGFPQAVAQPILHVPGMESLPIEQKREEPDVKHDENGSGPEVYHGTFSNCICKGCMEDAKKEVERRFTNETLTTTYIKKLEVLVNKLQFTLEQKEHGDLFGGPNSFGVMGSFSPPPIHPSSPPPPPPGFFASFPPPPPPPPPPGFSYTEAVLEDPVGHLPEESDGPKLLIVRKKMLLSQYGDEKVQPDDQIGTGEPSAKDLRKKSLLTVYRHFDKRNVFWRRSVKIRSPPFIEVLRESSVYDIDIAINEQSLYLTEPLMLLFHHRKQLAKYLQDNDTKEKNQIAKQSFDHTEFILNYMRSEFEDVTQRLDDLESAQPSGLIDFSDIWLLYAPGTVVYTTYNGEHEAYIVDSLHGSSIYPRNRSGKYSHSPLELTCWSINYDGEIFGREWTMHVINPYNGKKEISSLDLVPETFLPNAATVKENLVARGKSFWGLHGQNYREYTGEIWSQQMNDGPIRVMVDHLTYQRRMGWPISINKKTGPSGALSKNWRDNRFQSGAEIYNVNSRGRRGRRPNREPYVPDCIVPPPRRLSPTGCSPEREYDNGQPQEPYMSYKANRPPLRGNSKFNKYDALDPGSTPDALTLLLCPQRVHGYCLKHKIWKDLNVTQLKPATFRKNAWERLVLDEQYKDIIKAMASSYVDKSVKLDDLVAGKGAGLVALLHGPPGTGKTLTAECVAESFERPLYQVTCGDIGTDPELVEERLEEIFDYSVTWGAILLLDEADVFLQDRQYEDLQRNALVSIFLRTLEYFNGILFLTTNRVGTFDQAFQSRIHVTLGLPQLDRARRTEVWSLFLQDLRSKSLITPAHHAHLASLVADKWSREPLNGRQIRNSVRTALVVADNKKEVVAEKHFDLVLRIGKDFAGYLSALEDADREGRSTQLGGLEGFQEVEKP